MLKIYRDISLAPYHTFGTPTKAEKLYEVFTNNELIGLLQKLSLKDEKLFILGGGSNVLFTNYFKGNIIKINSKGITIEKQDDSHAWVKVAAGENWHSFVQWCMEKDYGGLENLSLIPGNVGAAPIQNIGAYGLEQKDSFCRLEAYNLQTKKTQILAKDDCQFSYRNSIFKQAVNKQFIILSVTYKLTKKHHRLCVDYGDITSELKQKNIQNISIQHIAEAVTAIRQRKLPEPKSLGNAGSFFKNPEIDKPVFDKILTKYPRLKGYPSSRQGKIKIPAAWLIEQAGWKGKRVGNAGVYKHHALVLVNYTQATGKEIYNLSEKIRKDVFYKFGIILEREVNIV